MSKKDNKIIKIQKGDAGATPFVFENNNIKL
jgi:hypothetical protein